MLDPAKKDVNCKADNGSTAGPLSLIFPENADQQWEKDDSRKDQIDDKDEVPGKPMLKKRRKDHRTIGGKKIEDDVADQNRETDFIITPEVVSSGYFYKEPTEEKRVKGDQQQRMSKIPMIFEIKMTIEETKNEINVRKKSCDHTCDRSPIPNFFIIDGPGNDCAG